jgi:hypothetical protein
MLLASSTDKIEIVLGANVTTNQLQFIASYNNISSTAVTPAKNVGLTNNTTAVDLVPSPAGSDERQLRWCSIFNSDSVASSVTVRINFNGTTRTVFSTILQVNEYIQYTHRTGWKVFDVNGAIKVQNNFNAMTDIRAQEFFQTTASTSNVTYSSPNTYCTYLGKSTGPYNSILVNFVVNVAITGTVSWAEMAIYKGKPSLGTGTTLTRLGVSNIAQTLTQTGQNRWVTVPVTGVAQGDDIWLVVGVNTTGTSPAFRMADRADVIGAGFIQTAGNNRPSTTLTLTGSISTTVNGMQSFWNGI